MNIVWILLLTTLVCYTKAVDKHLETQNENDDCPSEFCGPDLRPIPVVLHEKQQTVIREERIHEDRFPHGRDMIQTNFRCDGKPYIPGFYADMEADCKIFHLCLEKVVEHYMCPGHTAFNQATLVCEHEEKVQCHLTPDYYVMNADLHTGHPLVKGTKEFAFNKEADKWLYDVVHDDKEILDEDSIERSLIRMLILMKFIDVSDLLSDILAEEEALAPNMTETPMKATDSQFNKTLEHILTKVFPIIPVKYGSEPISHEEQSSSTEQSTGRIPKDAETRKDGRARLPKSFDFSTSPFHRARQIMEVILAMMAQIVGKISTLSRNTIVENHVNYLNEYFLNPTPVMEDL